MATTFDVLFLGAGPGGYVGAIRAAQLGLTVGVVEKDKPGGVCVNIGCIPTKALLHSAEVVNLLRHAKDLGITTGEISTDYGVAMKRSRRVAEQNSKGVEFLFKKHKIELIKGTGKLLPGRKIAVTGAAPRGADGDEGRGRRDRLAAQGPAAARPQARPQDDDLERRGALPRGRAQVHRDRGRRRRRVRVRRHLQRLRRAGHAARGAAADPAGRGRRDVGRRREGVPEARHHRPRGRADPVRRRGEGRRHDHVHRGREGGDAQGREDPDRHRARAEHRGDRAGGGRREAHRPRLHPGGRHAARPRPPASTRSATWPARRCWRTRGAARGSSRPRRSPARTRIPSTTRACRARPTATPRWRASD